MKKRYKIMIIAGAIITIVGCCSFVLPKIIPDDGYEKEIMNVEICSTIELFSQVNSLDFNPDGSKFVSGTGGLYWKPGEIKIFDTSTGRLQKSWLAYTFNIGKVLYTNDGLKIVSCGLDVDYNNEYTKSIKIFESTSGNIVRTWSVKRESKGDPLAVSLALSPDSAKIAAAGLENGTIKIFDISDGRLLNILYTNTDGSILFSSDGTKIISESHADGIKIWDIASGKVVAERKEYGGALALSSDGTKIISGNRGKQIRIYETNSLNLVNELKTRGNIKCVAYSRDGAEMVAGGTRVYQSIGAVGPGAKGTIDIWKVDSSYERTSSFDDSHSETVGAVAISPDCSKIITGSPDGKIKIWRKK